MGAERGAEGRGSDWAGERAPMLHHERLCPPLQGAVGVGPDFVATQCWEVRKESRVDHWCKGEARKEGQSEMPQCIYREMGSLSRI